MENKTNKWQMVDDEIRENFRNEVRDIKASSELKWKIDEQIKKSNQREKGIMKKWHLNKKVAVAIVMAVFVSTFCFAGGKVVSIIGGGHPDWLCYSYAKLDKAEKKLGFEVQAIEEFSNGYKFENIDVCENKELDEDDNVVGKYQQAEMKDIKEGKPNVSIYVEKTKNNNDTREPNATREYGENTLTYYLTHYKFVPVDYELTEEDQANLEREDYEISVGSDEVEESEIYSIHWEMGELSYQLMTFDTDMTSDELFDMAKEVIDTKTDSDL